MSNSMRVIGIVTLLAICGAAPTTASGTLAELQAQREQLLEQIRVEDPAKLWQAVSEKLPKSEKSIATDLAAMPKLLDAPPSVSEAIRLRDEHYLRNVVYGVYAQNRIPPAVERLYEQYAALYQQIEWATIRQKIDQKLGLEPPPTTPLK